MSARRRPSRGSIRAIWKTARANWPITIAAATTLRRRSIYLRAAGQQASQRSALGEAIGQLDRGLRTAQDAAGHAPAPSRSCTCTWPWVFRCSSPGAMARRKSKRPYIRALAVVPAGRRRLATLCGAAGPATAALRTREICNKHKGCRRISWPWPSRQTMLGAWPERIIR